MKKNVIESRNTAEPGDRYVYISCVDEYIYSPMDGTVSRTSPKIGPGKNVRKGELLLLFDNTEAFLNIRSAKQRLRADLRTVQPAIPAPDSAVFNAFAGQIQLNRVLPEFPHFSLATLQLLDQYQLLEHYDSIANEEAAMFDYFVYSPVSGKVVSAPAKATFSRKEILFLIRTDQYKTSPAVPGQKGQAITLSDEAGKTHRTTVIRQLKNATLVKGKLPAPGRYRVTQ